MAKEICISSTPHETRLAILEDDQLAEIYYERENEYTLAGSVYKGRVTRVLPGMQSAFVDIGLERDAFLYVTDFLEMEDQEDTDEVERAASQGDTVRLQPSTPVAQQAQSRPSRNETRNDQRSRRGEPRLAEGEGQPSPGLNVSPLATEESAEIPASVADATAQQDETDEQGARRWRGRRRRRGGRGRDESGAGTANEEPTVGQEQEIEEDSSLGFEAAATHPSQTGFPEPIEQPAFRRGPEASPAPAPFVMPGESLSKYGGSTPSTPAPSRLVLTELPPDTSPALPERTVAKPSTLIEDEIVWDGRGLFPGESIARHARTAPETPSASIDAEPSGTFVPHAEVENVSEPVPFEFSEQFDEKARTEPAVELDDLVDFDESV